MRPRRSSLGPSLLVQQPEKKNQRLVRDYRPTETVIRLQIQPMPAPKPALRYQLLPELRHMNPGNPVLGFMKCFPGLRNVDNKEANGIFENKEADDTPLEDLPLEKLRDYGGAVVAQAHYAARLDTPDWQVLLKMKTDSHDLIELLLPEVQQMRQLAQVLKRRFRVEIAGRRFDDALVTAQTMFALARVVGEHPTLIADLVGVAIVAINSVSLEEMIAQPGCPNLFWALSDLPRPLIDMRKGLQGEKILTASYFNKLDDKGPMTERLAQQVLNHLKTMDGGGKEKKQTIYEFVVEEVKDIKKVQAARRRLMEYGLTRDIVEQFPALQVILLDGKLSNEINNGEMMKGMIMPYWQAEPLLARTPKVDDNPFPQFLHGINNKVRGALARSDQRVDILRCIEALRMHAAENDGKLPARLEDIKLPLPVDPVTGQPFQYRLEAGIGHLRGTPLPGQEKFAVLNVRYEITIRK